MASEDKKVSTPSSVVAATQFDSKHSGISSDLSVFLFEITGIKFKPGAGNMSSATLLYDQRIDCIVAALTAALGNPMTLKKETVKGQTKCTITVESSEIECAKLKRAMDTVKNVYKKTYKKKFLDPFYLILKSCSPVLYLHRDQTISVVCNLKLEEVRLVANALRDAIRHFLGDLSPYSLVTLAHRDLQVNNKTKRLEVVDIGKFSPQEYKITVGSAKKMATKFEARLKFHREHSKLVAKLGNAKADTHPADQMRETSPTRAISAGSDAMVSILLFTGKLKNAESYINAFNKALDPISTSKHDEIFSVLLDKLTIENAKIKNEVYSTILKKLIDKAYVKYVREILIRDDLDPGVLLAGLNFAVITLTNSARIASALRFGTPRSITADHICIVKYLLEATAVSGAPGFSEAVQPVDLHFNTIKRTGHDITSISELEQGIASISEQRTIAVSNLLKTLNWSDERDRDSQGFFPNDIIKILIEYWGFDLSMADTDLKRPSSPATLLLPPETSQLMEPSVAILEKKTGLKVRYLDINSFEFSFKSQAMSEEFEEAFLQWLFKHGIMVEALNTVGTRVLLTAKPHSINDMAFGSNEEFTDFLIKHSNLNDSKQLQPLPVNSSSSAMSSSVEVARSEEKIGGNSQNFFGHFKVQNHKKEQKDNKGIENDGVEVLSINPG